MNKKMKAIVLIVIALVIVGGLHVFIFAPLKTQLDDYKGELSQLQSQVQRITSTAGGGGSLTSREGVTRWMDNVIKGIDSEIKTDREQFDTLNKQLKIIEHYDDQVNYRSKILDEIRRMKEVEDNSAVTKLAITNSWGVNEGIREGRFGTGFHASNGRSMAYANIETRKVIEPSQGTVEFYVKPDWDPQDMEVHHKSMFMAITVQNLYRDQLERYAENITDELGRPINLSAILPPTKGPFPVECMVAIYKGEGATLTFELKNFLQNPSTVTAYINDWKQGQWYHVLAVWKEKQQALYINGQNKGIPYGSGVSIRSARDLEDELLLGGGGGMGMGMMGMGGMGMMGMGGMGMMGMGRHGYDGHGRYGYGRHGHRAAWEVDALDPPLDQP